MVLQSSACSWFSDANLCARRGSFEVHDCKSKYYLVFITKQIELQSHIPLCILLKPLSLFHLLCKKTYTKRSTLQRLHNTFTKTWCEKRHQTLCTGFHSFLNTVTGEMDYRSFHSTLIFWLYFCNFRWVNSTWVNHRSWHWIRRGTWFGTVIWRTYEKAFICNYIFCWPLYSSVCFGYYKYTYIYMMYMFHILYVYKEIY